jgi:hypothetical protein
MYTTLLSTNSGQNFVVVNTFSIVPPFEDEHRPRSLVPQKSPASASSNNDDKAPPHDNENKEDQTIVKAELGEASPYDANEKDESVVQRGLRDDPAPPYNNGNEKDESVVQRELEGDPAPPYTNPTPSGDDKNV